MKILSVYQDLHQDLIVRIQLSVVVTYKLLI